MKILNCKESEMTVLELRLIQRILDRTTDTVNDVNKAKDVIEREIRLRTTNYVTGERLPEEPTQGD